MTPFLETMKCDTNHKDDCISKSSEGEGIDIKDVQVEKRIQCHSLKLGN